MVPPSCFMPQGFYLGCSLSDIHPFISWVTPTHPPKHCSGITSSVEYCLSFLETLCLAAIYWVPLYWELWDVLGTGEWLRQFILCNFTDEMKWCKKKSSVNDKVKHLTATCIGLFGDLRVGATVGRCEGRSLPVIDGIWLCLWMNGTGKDHKEYRAFWAFRAKCVCQGRNHSLSGCLSILRSDN